MGKLDEDQWVAEVRSWIRAGGIYRLRPSTAPPVALSALAFFFPALVIFSGLVFADPSLAVEAAVVALLPLLAIAMWIRYGRMACLYGSLSGGLWWTLAD
ncbi:MAG: hypothetical protein WCC30_03940 [Candidatus Dormiibacterota bacterium]